MALRSPRPLHVLVLPSWFPETHLPNQGWFFIDQARALQRAGHRVGVIYPAHRTAVTGIDELEVRSAEAGFVWKAGPLNALRYTQASLGLYRAYCAERGVPDVIHAQSAIWAGVGAAAIRRVHGVPVVLSEHASNVLSRRLAVWRRPFLRVAARSADEMTVVGMALAAALRELDVERELHLIPNTVDTQYFAPRVQRPEGGFVVLTVCNLLPRKRVDLVVRAFARAYSDDPQARLEIGGEGPERGAIEQLVASLGLSDRVVFLGALSRSEVLAAMQRADLFALGSDHETFGVVLIEALATGMPVVATRSGGPDEIVTPALGQLVARGDELGFAAALHDVRARLTAEDATWRAACAEHARSHYSYEVFVQRIEPILWRAVNRGSVPGR